jgi:hypothetical protein
VSISNDQRRPIPWANWQATVYHGLPRNLHTFRERPGIISRFWAASPPHRPTVDLLLVRHEYDVGVNVLHREGDVQILVG